MNQNALWQLKSSQTKTRKTKTASASEMAAVKKVGQKNDEIVLLVGLSIYSVFILCWRLALIKDFRL